MNRTTEKIPVVLLLALTEKLSPHRQQDDRPDCS
jgi:hypothetical protein